MMKYAAFKLAGVALSLSLSWSSAQAAALRVAADPVPHAEILNYIKKIDPRLDLKIVALTSGVNAGQRRCRCQLLPARPLSERSGESAGQNLRRRGDRPY